MSLSFAPISTFFRFRSSPSFGRIAGVMCIVAIFALSVAIVAAREYANPIISGDWSDPGVIRVGDDYYTCRSSFGWQPGIPVAHSRDLLHWEYVGHAFATHSKLQPGDTRGGIWGVEMGFNPNTHEYLIYAPTRDYEVYVFHATHPGGPYEMKTLGTGLGIDPGFFADADGRLYLILNRGIIYELGEDGLSIKKEVAHIDRRRFKLFEGPALLKHGDWYYLLFSDGGTLPHEPSTISTLRSKKLEGPWEEDPHNPVMFSTDSGARFEGPAHGTLLETPKGEWFLTYHAHETAFYSLGRQLLMEPIVWTSDGWWKPVGGKVPSLTATAPDVPPSNLRFAQSDEFDTAELGLQWFFTCPPDFTGASWSLKDKPGFLRIHTRPGNLGTLEALPGIFQQRVVDKAFSFETKLTFNARAGRESAGLQMYHDPRMSFWLVSTVRDGEKRIEVGKISLRERTDLWSVPNVIGNTLHLKIVINGEERATFFYGPNGREWKQLGESIYFGASAHHLRNGVRGDPDLGWVGLYKDKSAFAVEAAARLHLRPDERLGNVWTGTTFGVFAVRDGATESSDADFDYLHVTKP